MHFKHLMLVLYHHHYHLSTIIIITCIWRFGVCKKQVHKCAYPTQPPHLRTTFSVSDIEQLRTDLSVKPSVFSGLSGLIGSAGAAGMRCCFEADYRLGKTIGGGQLWGEKRRKMLAIR